MTEPIPPEKTKGKGNKHGKGGGVSKRPGKAMGGTDPSVPREGRPPALTTKIHQAIVDSVELLGMAEGRAGMVIGFDPSIISKWKTRGQKSLKAWDTLTPQQQAIELRYLKFFTALRDALPKFEQANLLIIQRAAMGGDWRAADRRLAMKMPDDYGKRFMMGGDPKNPIPLGGATKAVIYIPDNGRNPEISKPDPQPPA